MNDAYRARLADRLRRPLHVGDRIPTGFFSSKYAAVELTPDVVATPIGVEHLRISGFGRMPDEVLPDGLYPANGSSSAATSPAGTPVSAI